MAQKKYTTVSLFSGAMGLDIGLEQTGRFGLLAVVEKEPAFAATIRKNRDAGRVGNKKLRVYEADITTLDPFAVMRECGLEPGELDVLVGGPPCQSFSTAGRRGTVNDPRGTLIWQFLRFIEAMRPRFFLMENVRGLLSAALSHRVIAERPERGGEPLRPEETAGSVVRLFADDLRRIPGAPYHLDVFEVNAVNYGAPQLRERALFIGNRYGALVDFPDPTHGEAASGSDGPLLFPGNQLKPYRTLGDAIHGLRESERLVMDFSPRKKRYLAMVPPGGNWRMLPIEDQKASMGKAWLAKGGRSGWWRRLSYDLPCPTLMTMPNHAGTSLCHPVEVRALSVREYALIQEFPPDWEFVGTPLEQYTQVGNAVPVRLGAVAGQVIAEALDSLRARKWQRVSRTAPPFRLVYVRSHVRTRQWFKAGKAFVWSDGTDNGHAAYTTKEKTVRAVRGLR